MEEYNGPCEAGCMRFHGGEVRHVAGCGYYSESLTKFNADRIEALEAENARLREAAQAVISAYNEANPMRSADFHRDGCNCCRCAFDLLCAALKQEGGE